MKAIAAVDKNWGIGYEGELLFRISEDMKRFRELTTGNIVIMGHKTLETLPGGMPLKNRENIVFTRNTELVIPGTSLCYSTGMLEQILNEPKYAGKEAYVIGGAEIYDLLLAYCDTALITRVNDEKPADRFFPNLSIMPEWELVDESEDQGGFIFAKYINKRTSGSGING